MAKPTQVVDAEAVKTTKWKGKTIRWVVQRGYFPKPHGGEQFHYRAAVQVNGRNVRTTGWSAKGEMGKARKVAQEWARLDTQRFNERRK